MAPHSLATVEVEEAQLAERLERARSALLSVQRIAAEMYLAASRRGEITNARGFDLLASLAENALEDS